MERVTWRGTPGVGDFMWALNCVHHYAYTNNVKVKLEMHWEHGEDYLHHFEDPETIVERMDYIHNFYYRKNDVEVSHEFYSDNERYRTHKYTSYLLRREDGQVSVERKPLIDEGNNKGRFWFESGYYTDTGEAPINNWLFRPDAFQETDRRKVVIWTPNQNAELPRHWKRKLTEHDWSVIIHKLRRAGLNVVELNYRTPVREAMYHISTCRQVVCYDGMWHYIAKNFAKPLAVISKEGVTKYHTEHAIRVCPDDSHPTNIWYWMDNVPDLLGRSKKKAVDWENKLKMEIQWVK